jgi:hypothetical protein
MPISIPTPAAGADEEVEPVVAVARTVGGLALLLIGLVLAIGGAFVYFIVPFIAPFQGGIWNTLWDLDFVGAIVGGIGLVLVVVAGAILRRAKKRDLQIQFGAGEMDGVADNINDIVDSATPGEKRTGNPPPTIL